MVGYLREKLLLHLLCFGVRGLQAVLDVRCSQQRHNLSINRSRLGTCSGWSIADFCVCRLLRRLLSGFFGVGLLLGLISLVMPQTGP